MTEAALLLDERLDRLELDLLHEGLTVVSLSLVEEIVRHYRDKKPDLLIVGVEPESSLKTAEALRQIEETAEAYLLALVTPAGIDRIARPNVFDDVLLVDYTADELGLRLALMRSRLHRVEARPPLRIGGLTIDNDSFEVRTDGALVPLTHREYELLAFLAHQRGRVFTRETLVEKIWKYEYLSGSRTVDVHVRRLRSKLGPRYGDLIETIRYVGYRFSRRDPD